MSFLSELDQSVKVSKARQRVYTNVDFSSKFANVLAALEIANLYEDCKPLYSPADGGYVWTNNVGKDGLFLCTSNAPVHTKGKVEKLIVRGSQTALDVFETILHRYSNITEKVAPEKVKLNIAYHETLNPLFWKKVDDEYQLDKDTEKKMQEIVDEFLKFLKTPALPISDLVLTGSIVNFNWTDQSDVDIHVLVDMPAAEKVYSRIIEEYLQTRGKLWNVQHEITIHGRPVEVYIQDDAEEHV